jgi:hypothetical protein
MDMVMDIPPPSPFPFELQAKPAAAKVRSAQVKRDAAGARVPARAFSMFEVSRSRAGA